MDSPSVRNPFFQRPKMSRFHYERGSPTLTLRNVLGALVVINVLNVLHMLKVLDMPMDASLASWALFI